MNKTKLQNNKSNDSQPKQYIKITQNLSKKNENKIYSSTTQQFSLKHFDGWLGIWL